MTAASFEALARELGDVRLHTEVRVRAEVDSYLCDPRPMDLHTDDPRVDWIAWRCVEQDPDDGASLLVDLAATVAGLPDRVRADLAGATLSGGKTSAPARVFTPETGRCFWAPWLNACGDSDALRAIEALRCVLAEAPRRRIRLARGEVLVVDNARMMHGRAALRSDSPRHLERRWITRFTEGPRQVPTAETGSLAGEP
jgi:hypothetical protein